MKLNVTPNAGWTGKTIGKLNTWSYAHAEGSNTNHVKTTTWEPESSTLGKVTITTTWDDTLIGNFNISLYGTFDGSTWVSLAAVGAQVSSGDAAGNQTTVIDLSSYPSGQYKINLHSAGNSSGINFVTYITEQ